MRDYTESGTGSLDLIRYHRMGFYFENTRQCINNAWLNSQYDMQILAVDVNSTHEE